MQCNFLVWPHSTVSASQYLVIDEASKCVLLNFDLKFNVLAFYGAEEPDGNSNKIFIYGLKQ